MQTVPSVWRLVAVLASGVALAGCGTSARVQSATSPSSALRGSITVFAAASLNRPFTTAEHTLEARYPGFAATYSFAGSQQLVQNVLDGAPADVIATANPETMQRLVAQGLVGTPTIFARNRLEIAVAPGNPKGIRDLADLARPGLSVVLADPSVPAGQYAVQALTKAGVSVTPKSRELDVATVLERVESGDADAAIVYTTDVEGARGSVSGVAIPDADNVIAAYPIAVVKTSRNVAAGEAFVAETLSGLIQSTLRSEGFLPP